MLHDEYPEGLTLTQGEFGAIFDRSTDDLRRQTACVDSQEYLTVVLYNVRFRSQGA